MYKGSKQILKVPAFDLTWLDFDNGDEAVALVPGGGGSTKSGVKNQIQIVSPDETHDLQRTDPHGQHMRGQGLVQVSKRALASAQGRRCAVRELG